MDRLLKQRLLGAVILVALLVILLPEWLDGAGHKSRYPQHTSIPEKPVFQPMPELMGKSREPEPVPLQPQPEAGPAPVQAPAPAEEIKPRVNSAISAWALQVGSFNDQGNAQVLRDRLRAKGYPAYIDKQASADKDSFRVRIGPELDHGRIESLRKTILESEKINGMIVKHP